MKQSLNAFKLIQHRFNKFQHGFKRVANGLTLLFNNIEWMLKQMLKNHNGNGHTLRPVVADT